MCNWYLIGYYLNSEAYHFVVVDVIVKWMIIERLKWSSLFLHYKYVLFFHPPLSFDSLFLFVCPLNYGQQFGWKGLFWPLQCYQLNKYIRMSLAKYWFYLFFSFRHFDFFPLYVWKVGKHCTLCSYSCEMPFLYVLSCIFSVWFVII